MPRPFGPAIRTSKFTALDENPVEDIALGPVAISNIDLINNHTADVYLKIFNKEAADVTLASDEPDQEITLTPGTNTLAVGDERIIHDTAISIAVTANQGIDNTAPAAQATGYVYYKKTEGKLSSSLSS